MAAETARQEKDYATAEKQLRTVIALSPRFAEAYMNLGLIYELEDRREQAVPQFEKAALLKPQLTGAQFFLGVDDCKLGDAAQAIPHLQAATRAKPDLPEAWLWLATAQEMTGQTSQEVKTLQAGLRSNPQNIDLLYLLGHADEELGKSEVDRLQKAQPDSSYVEQLLAENYATSGYASVALLHLQNALRETPRRPGLHLEEAEVFLHAGNLQRAREEIAAELALDPHSLAARVRRGEIELLGGDVAAALSDWAEAMAVDAPRTEAILGLRQSGFGDASAEKLPTALRLQLDAMRSQIASRQGPARDLALTFLEVQAGSRPARIFTPTPAMGAGPSGPMCTPAQLAKWLADDQLEPVAACSFRLAASQIPLPLRLEVARAAFATGRPAQALKILEALPSGSASAAEARYWKARCYERLALAADLQLFQLDPDSYRAHEILGDLDVARGEDNQAIAEYQQALAQRPTLPNLHYQVGHLEWKVYKVEEARREFLAELRLNPRHAGTLLDLGNTYLYERQPDKALTYLHQVARLDPHYPDIHEFLGMAYSQLREYPRAEAELKIAVVTDKDGRIHYQLGRVYQALAMSAEAEREFSISDKLKHQSEQENVVRVQEIAAAEAALKPQ